MSVIDAPRTSHEDVPRRAAWNPAAAIEVGGCGAAGLAAAWVPLQLTGWDAPFGFFVLWFVSFLVILGVVVRQRHGVLELKDRMATVLITAGTGFALLPLVLILVYVVVKGGGPVLARFPHFLTHDMHLYGPTDPASKAGMEAAIIGTLEQVGLATVVTVPVGILAATYINEIGGRLAAIVRTVADAMTGLPTVIAGLFVYAAWVKPRGTAGHSGWAAAMALMVIMLPTMVRTSEEVLRIVAGSLREAALALGAPEWRVILRIVIPTARTGLVTAALLAIARALGETAPVLLTAFGSAHVNVNPFSGPQASLTIQVYTLVRSASNHNVAVGNGGALVLVILILTLFTLARILGAGERGRRRRPPLRQLLLRGRMPTGL